MYIFLFPNIVSFLLYLRLRRDEIEAMCSHKLDTNPELNCLDELVKMSVTYDMLHKNIHKELAINTDIVDNEIVLRPSCRGNRAFPKLSIVL